jgi:hypothetical protein
MTGQSSAGVTNDDAIDSTATVVATSQDANSEQQEQSSSSEDVTETTLADVVRNAAKAVEAPESSDRKNGGEAEQSTDDKSASEQGQTPNADDAKPKDDDVPFHKHPRWQEKLKVERELRQQVDTFKASHEQFEQIQGFMRSNALEAQEVANGFEIMALMRRDPEAAFQRLQPYLQQLEMVTGRKLPEDLQKRVEDGVADEATAREAALLRIETQRRHAAEQSTNQVLAQQTQVQAIQTIQSAVSVVERELQSGDPDYARKQPFVMDRVRALILEQQPRTPEEATAIVRQAHSEISDRLKPMIQRKPVSTATSGNSASGGQAAPKSFAEAVRLAAAGK